MMDSTTPSVLTSLPALSTNDEGKVRVGGLVGGTVGTAVGWLGAAYAVTELLGGGGGLRFRDA